MLRKGLQTSCQRCRAKDTTENKALYGSLADPIFQAAIPSLGITVWEQLEEYPSPVTQYNVQGL